MNDIANTAISITDFVGKAAQFGSYALPVAQFVAGFFPGAAPAVQVIAALGSILPKVAALAPSVRVAIKSGEPILDAIQASGPDFLQHLKQIYATAVNADPNRPETGLRPEDVSMEDILKFAALPIMNRPWTQEEENRWFDKASNVGGG